MKLEDIEPGIQKFGPFTISIHRPVFEKLANDNLNYFEVLVTQEDNLVPGFIYYINLVTDERFLHFKFMQTFSRPISNDDMVEFNSHASSVFHKIGMPTFKLSRRSILNLMDECYLLAKKIKKNKGKQS